MNRNRTALRAITFSLLLSVTCLAGRSALAAERTEIGIPDVLGYLTLKCDFHMHTVFSDGLVWPTVRVGEAWRDGLDAISITDHIEYQPHKEDIPTNHNRPFEIAKPTANSVNLILLRGSEITRAMPPGHLNAIFLKDCDAIATEEWTDSIQEAANQGAFIFWNHPGWTGQQADGIGKWYEEHTMLLEKGLLHGIEVVNSRSYYPEAHRWCLEHGLAMISNSDVHPPIDHAYVPGEGTHRPITLVFAKSRDAQAIHEALSAARTAVYHEDKIIGKEEFLRAIFDNSVTVKFNKLNLQVTHSASIQIHNASALPFQLKLAQPCDYLELPKTVTVPAGKTVLFTVKAKVPPTSDWADLKLSYVAENLLIEPDKGCPVSIPVQVKIAE